MKILADATLPGLPQAFPPPFKLSYYHDLIELRSALPTHSILLCRSTLKVTQALLHPHHLNWLLTASSGRDHLDEPYLARCQTKILDAKGSNAHAVVDYVLSTLAYLEKTHHFHPHTIGIVGVGAVGGHLLQTLTTLGFHVSVHDPVLATRLPSFHSVPLMQLADCDLVCLHPNLHHTPPYPSFHLINSHFLNARTPHTAIINASRGEVVNETALCKHHQGLYCTDVYANEPNVNPAVIRLATVCTPHIAGHTLEAKMEAVRTLSLQLHAHLKLTPPQFLPYPTVSLATSDTEWHTRALAIYHPLQETQALKQAVDLKQSFLTLRAAHVRHGSEYHLWA